MKNENDAGKTQDNLKINPFSYYLQKDRKSYVIGHTKVKVLLLFKYISDEMRKN